MSTQSAPDDGEFERWLEDRLDTHLGVHADGAAPSNARYRTQARRRVMRGPMQVALATAVAVLAIGGGAAYAAGLVHGTSVSNAANSCPTSPADAHGDCVATVAHSSTTSSTTTTATSTRSNNDTHGDVVSNAAHTCPTSPPGAHGQCVSNVASGGKSGGNASTTSTGSSPAATPHGNSGNGPPPGNSHS